MTSKGRKNKLALTPLFSLVLCLVAVALTCHQVYGNSQHNVSQRNKNSDDWNSMQSHEHTHPHNQPQDDPDDDDDDSQSWIANLSISYLNFSKEAHASDPIKRGDGVMVFSNNALNSQFNRKTWNKDCCSSPELFNYMFNPSEQPALLIRNLNTTDSLWLTSFSIQAQITNGMHPQLRAAPNSPALIRIDPLSTTLLDIDVQCKEPYDADNYWAAISIDLSFSPSQNIDAPMTQVSIYYFYVCDEEFRPVKYEASLALLTVVLVIFVYFQAIDSTPRSIIFNEKFKRFEVKWFHAWIYAILLLIIVILDQSMNPKVLQRIMDDTMGMIAGSAAWFFTAEIQCTFKSYHNKVKKVLFKIGIFSFQIMDLVSMAVAVSLICFQVFTGKAWYSSDLLALCVLGSLMKLLKFKALKQAFGFMLICLFVDSIGGFVVYLSRALSYDAIFINNYNEPFLIAVPIWKMFYDKPCSWLPVLGTAFPGVLINLCFRFDRSQKNVSTKAFTYIGSIGYILGTMIYILSTMFNNHSWPYSLVNFPVMGLFIFLFAYKRGDHLILWHGSFYDFDSSRNRKLIDQHQENEDENDESNNRLFEGLTLLKSVDNSKNDISNKTNQSNTSSQDIPESPPEPTVNARKSIPKEVNIQAMTDYNCINDDHR